MFLMIHTTKCYDFSSFAARARMGSLPFPRHHQPATAAFCSILQDSYNSKQEQKEGLQKTAAKGIYQVGLTAPKVEKRSTVL